jgi:hypothetical protein
MPFSGLLTNAWSVSTVSLPRKVSPFLQFANFTPGLLQFPASQLTGIESFAYLGVDPAQRVEQGLGALDVRLFVTKVVLVTTSINPITNMDHIDSANFET